MKAMPDSQALSRAAILYLLREVLICLGEDPDRDGLRNTPRSLYRSLRDLTHGYRENPEEILLGATFNAGCDEMVVVKNIEMFSLGERHVLPFFGKVHIAYIPRGKVIGLTRFSRLVDLLAGRPQVQERLTRQIAEAVNNAIRPLGVGVVIEARHLCMMMRGVQQQHSSAITFSMLGALRNKETRDEFLAFIRVGNIAFS
jgi:GTP cyclohydrolase I